MIHRGEDIAYFLSIDVSPQIRRAGSALLGRHTAGKHTWYGHGSFRISSWLKYGQSLMVSCLELFVYDHVEMMDRGKKVRTGFFRTRLGQQQHIYYGNWYREATPRMKDN